MKYEEIMAAKYKGTAFAILFEDRTIPQPPTKAEALRESKRRTSEKNNAKLRENKARFDTRQKANWTI
jgi:hypothetical protein